MVFKSLIRTGYMIFIFVFVSVLTNVKLSSLSGSNLHLKEIFLGRCWDYRLQKPSKSLKNCTEIWSVFYGGFAYKDPCSLNFSDYEPYFTAVGGGDIVNKSLFWSGTYKAVHSYSDFDNRFTTLEDTMAGWIPNGLTWCGNASLSRNSSDGIDYVSCPAQSACDYITAFWGLASKRFAEKASGVVQVMVNGTRATVSGDPIPAYSRYSFFGKYELPNLRVDKVKELRVLVAHTIDEVEHETCNNGSIKMLQGDARAHGLTVKCFDDPKDVKHILCADYPLSRECLFLLGHEHSTSHKDKDETWKIIAIVFICTTGVLLMVLLMFLVLRLLYGYERFRSRSAHSDSFRDLV